MRLQFEKELSLFSFLLKNGYLVLLPYYYFSSFVFSHYLYSNKYCNKFTLPLLNNKINLYPLWSKYE